MQRRLTIALAAVALAAATAVPATAATSAATEAEAPAQAAPSSAKKHRTVDARKLLGKLKVTAERSATRYQRSKFPHWIDADRNGCDTRREVLIAEARKPLKIGRGCWVTTGRWTSYFDNKKHTRASKLDIDHLVPLAEAWRSGASTWDARTRKAFANDLGYEPTLVAVTSSVNRKKSDKDPASWLPAKNTCRYVAEWVGVKARWGLSVDKAEKKTINRTLKGCSKADRKVTKPSKAKIGKEPAKPKPDPPKKPEPPKPEPPKPEPPKPEPPRNPEPEPTPDPAPSPDPEPDDGVVVKTFANCTDLLGTYPNGVAVSEAATSGLKRKPFVHSALYRANDKMDRDKDGVACEQG